MKSYFLIIITILLLSACGNQPIRPDRPQYQGLAAAQSAYRAQNYTQSAYAYEQLYQQHGENNFALFAADSWLQAGQNQKAEAIMSRIDRSSHPLYQLIDAQLKVNHGNYNFYLDDVTGEYAERYLKLKILVETHKKNYLEAAMAQIELSELQPQLDLTKSIIEKLKKTPENYLTQALFNSQLSRLQQGWLEAAYASMSRNSSAITQWRNNWNNHPAIAFFGSSQQYSNIAVLLPMSGKYKNISKSIQQGMLAAIYDENSPLQLTFFDTGSNGESFSYAWYGAIESGAEFIIGPLEKNSVEQLNSLNSSTMPVLLLNEVANEDNPNGFYQFSLSQNDEVRNVAMRLMAENKKRVMLLAPETAKGQALAKVFEEELSFFGGEIVSYAFYPNTAKDYSRELKQALGLNESKARHKKIQKLLAMPLENETQIRPDIDAIFLIAKAKQARLIKPQLKFYQAEKVPVFSTSQVLANNANPSLDADLDGIKFCMSAFAINPQSKQELVGFNTQTITSNPKFFAFGYDAIALNTKLEHMQMMQDDPLMGMSGKLTVDGNGKVHRELSWAQFKNGLAVGIPSIELITDELMPTETTLNN